MFRYPLDACTSVYTIHYSNSITEYEWRHLGRLSYKKALEEFEKYRAEYAHWNNKDPSDLHLVRKEGSEELLGGTLPSWNVYLKTGPIVTYPSLDEESALKKVARLADELGLSIDTFRLECADA